MQAVSLARRSSHSIGRVAAVALLSLCLHGWAAIAQNDVRPAEPPGPAAAATGAPLVDALLGHADSLRLSPEQARIVRLLRLDLQEKETRLAAERRAVELQLQRQQATDPAAFNPTDEALRRIEDLGRQIERARHDALQQALAALSAEQRSRIAQPPFPPLAPARGDEAGDAQLDRQIAAALDRRLKDSKVVEYETSEAIANRLMDWAKTLGWVAGIPLAILAAVLALFGLKTYSDFKNLVESAGDEVKKESAEIKELIAEADTLEPQLVTARQQIEEMATLKQSMNEMSNAAHQQMQEIDALRLRMGQVTEKVDRIEKAITFQKSEALTPALQKSLEDTIEAFRGHLTQIGFPTEGSSPTGYVHPTLDNAHYDASENKIVIGALLVNDPDIAVREYARHVLERMHPDFPYTAILSGLADYLTCSFYDRPKLAEKSAPALRRKYGPKLFKHGYLRTMDNRRTFAELGPKPEMHDAGEVWGGAFWEIRALLGTKDADRLLLTASKETPSRDDSPQSFVEFARTVVRLARRNHAAHAAGIQTIFQRRGIALTAERAVSG
jgi:hypothetical protein